MLGMDRATLLKIQIIETLDGLQAPISLKELQEKIGHASLGTIRVNCKELQGIIEDLYTEEDYSLNLRMNNGRGIQLNRSSTNLQSLTSYLYKQDLACEIIRTVLAKRKISAIQFCMDNNISESKLRRKIKEINQDLTDYDLYISCSAKMSLKGREIDIRRFYYIFIRGLYHQFIQIEWINTETYFQLAQQIGEYLKLMNNPTNLEMISFWLLITNQSLSKKGTLVFNDAELDWLNRFKYPKKPAFLKTWDTNEWKFFLYAIYSSLLNDFELQPKNSSQELFFDQAISRWIEYFTHYFRPLNSREQKFVARKIRQHYAAFALFRLNDPMIDQLRNSVALNDVQTDFPYYFRRFDAFWKDFTQAVPGFDRRQLRIYSFLTCVTLFSIENCLPELSVYVFSEHSELFGIFIQEKINLHFKNRYHLNFVDDPRDARLIIGTSPSCKNFLSEGQKCVIIRSNISATDYLDIEAILESMVNKDLAQSKE
ncbi:helix-turn-helix domain-containing protein [Enterococcus sp.]|uniref:helix-turn-helix domain-containing protein n=1 Tax=Enterococcus sp. TaxID=35783 RepID=UPI002906FD41|nr:helix-turn-helix domain-containing protein [Enterococcus sp.]MDU5336958.1 helix-turn-helix domain-containing protein [Enterococcus sp.]